MLDDILNWYNTLQKPYVSWDEVYSTSWLVLAMAIVILLALNVTVYYRERSQSTMTRRQRKQYVTEWASDQVHDILLNGLVTGQITEHEYRDLMRKFAWHWSDFKPGKVRTKTEVIRTEAIHGILDAIIKPKLKARSSNV